MTSDPQKVLVTDQQFSNEACRIATAAEPFITPSLSEPSGLELPDKPGMWTGGANIMTFVYWRDDRLEYVRSLNGHFLSCGFVDSLPRGRWQPAQPEREEAEAQAVAEHNYQKWQHWRSKCGDAENALEQVHQQLALALARVTIAERNSEANWQLYMDMHAKWEHATKELEEGLSINNEMKSLLDQACDQRDAAARQLAEARELLLPKLEYVSGVTRLSISLTREQADKLIAALIPSHTINNKEPQP
jgi:uncharacterized protein YukE